MSLREEKSLVLNVCREREESLGVDDGVEYVVKAYFYRQMGGGFPCLRRRRICALIEYVF